MTQETDCEYLPIPDSKHDQGSESHTVKRQITYVHNTTSRIQDFFKYKIFFRTKWMIVPLFLSFSVVVIVISSLYFMNDITENIAFGVVLSTNLIGSIMGATMVYRFGTVAYLINCLGYENNEYERDCMDLDKVRKKVSNGTKHILFAVHKLKSISEDLDEQLKNFESLREQLSVICEKNESMKDDLEYISEICNNLLAAQRLNQRAHLLSMYYDLCAKEHTDFDYLTERDYQRFLGRLNQETREEFEMRGGFDSIDINNDGKIDTHEFELLINSVLEVTEDQETKTLRKLKELHY